MSEKVAVAHEIAVANVFMPVALQLYLLAKREERNYDSDSDSESSDSEEEVSELFMSAAAAEMTSEQPTSSKRRLEDVDNSQPEEHSVATKRPRHDYDDFDEFAPTPEPEHTLTPDPTSLLPLSSDTFIQLRFQLCRFKGVYRVARLPLSFTFAHLYKFILLIFGWSGHHAHQAEVVTHAVLYSANWKRGEIKKHRSFRVPEEPDREDVEEHREWVWSYARNSRDPAMRVTSRGSRRVHPPPDPNDPWDVLMAKLEVPVKKDSEVTLGDIWAMKSRNNLSKGECKNLEIAIKFEYDLGGECSPHIGASLALC